MRRDLAVALLLGGGAITWLALRSSPAPEAAGTAREAGSSVVAASAAARVDPPPPAPNVPRPSPVITAAPTGVVTVWVPAPTPSMIKQAEANRRSVQEAKDTGRYPERLGAHVRPPPFDLARWKANPQVYLDVVEPGRVYQTAPPGPGVKRIEPVGAWVHEVPDSTPATLEVEAEPDSPVTFTAFGAGAFDNALGTITVRADKAGKARVLFTPAPGAPSSVRILVGSPLRAGQAVFHVGIKLEE